MVAAAEKLIYRVKACPDCLAINGILRNNGVNIDYAVSPVEVSKRGSRPVDMFIVYHDGREVIL